MARNSIVIFLLFFSSLLAQDSKSVCAQEVAKIDQQIEKLTQQRDQHAALAAQYQKQGDLWKYRSGDIEDAYAAWGKASQERSAAFDLQQQIDQLKDKKERIYWSYPSLRPRDS